MKIQLFLLLLSLGVFAQNQESILCNLCNTLLNTVYDTILNKRVLEFLKKPWHNLCDNKWLDPAICEQIYTTLIETYALHLPYRISPSVICPKYGLCPSRVEKSSIISFEQKMLKNKPPRSYPLEIDTPNNLHFAVINDAHIDMNYTTNRSSKCHSVVCCRIDSPPIQGQNDIPGKWGTLGPCDLPLRTALNAIDSISELPHKPDFIVWLGDNPAHDVYVQNQDTHKEIIRSLTEKIKEKYGNIGDAYPVLGNHEGLPIDHMNTKDIGKNWLLVYLSDLWKQWLTPQSYETFRKYGYYSQLHRNTTLRIIALNCLVHDAMNSYIWDNVTDQFGQLSWLENTLKFAEQNNENVLILGHFPPFNQHANPEYSKRYLLIIDRYANIIRGQLFAHTHQDSFQIIKSRANSHEFSGIGFEHASLSAIYEIIPSYRVYILNPNNFVMLDYDQYRFNLSKANKEDIPEWNLSYKFKEYYNVTNMRDYTLWQLANKILTQDSEFKKFAKMIYAEGPRSNWLFSDSAHF